jgi:metal-responsive CopG/Arc/MetJ family transcriptional regulator
MHRAQKMQSRRTTRRSEERDLSSATATKKVIIEFPEKLLKQTEEAASKLSTNRSELIRSLVEDYLAKRRREEFEKSLAEGYRAFADFDRRVAEEFAFSDDDTL